MATTPTITRPNKNINLLQPSIQIEKALKSPDPTSQPFSPLFFQKNSTPKSPTLSPNAIIPRPPVVHFFVCDYGNAKVKTVSDQFIELLVQNGIRVFTERYATHQPGFQVRAASLNSSADFFFQIHSKTAGPGHVRLYLDGQPKRMTLNEAVSDVWAWWRLMCGAITKTEVDFLSQEKLKFALKVFAGLNADDLIIDNLQKEIRSAIAAKCVDYQLVERMSMIESSLSEGRRQILSQKSVALEWTREPGQILTRCLPAPVLRGLSQPLRDLLLALLDQTANKLSVLSKIISKYKIESPMHDEVPISSSVQIENGPDIEIPIDGVPGPGLSWGAMLESIDDDDFGMNQIASYGEFGHATPGSLRPPFFLDDF